MDYSCKKEIEEYVSSLSVQKLPTRLPLTEIHAVHEKSKFMIETFVRIVQPINQYMQGHFFILTNDMGIVLKTFGSQDILNKLEDLDIGPGFSFAMPHSGVNAISLAMELQEMASVTGEEHQLDIFNSWNCLCKPICLHDQVIGYLDLTVTIGTELDFVIPLLELLVTVLERFIHDCHPYSNEQKIELLFTNCGLTKREFEVGHLWLQNRSAYSISKTLCISEGTVRNVIKRIYAKTGVGDKCQFLRKFLID